MLIKGSKFRFGAKHTPSKHDVDPMLVQCWPTICDAVPASNQHWFNASCLLGCVQSSKHKTFVQYWTNFEDVVPTLYNCYTNVLCLLGIAAWSGIACSLLLAAITSRHRPNVCKMLVQRRRCWLVSILSYSQYFILPYLHAGGIVQSRCCEPKLV